jgi:lambda family phage portal protein
VQLDSWGAPTGFWVTRDHPGDRLATRRWTHEFWPVRRAGRLNVMQVYSQDRIGQARGLPLLHACLPLLEQVSQYVDSTVLAAEIQTRMSLWIKTQGDPEAMAELMRLQSSAGRSEVDYSDYTGMGVEAGSINLLNAGDEVQTAAPTSPGQYFDPFVVRLLRMIGSAAGGVPYEIFANDVGSGNYSSIRAGFMGFRKTIHRWQGMVIRLLDAYRRHVLYEAWLDGKLLPAAAWLRLEDDLDGWMACTWTPPAMGWIDPTKEVRAYAEAVKERFMSRQEVISAVGGPGYAAVARQLAEEAQIDRDVGLVAAPVAEEPEPDPDLEEADEDEQLEDEEQLEDDELDDELEDEVAEEEALQR